MYFVTRTRTNSFQSILFCNTNKRRIHSNIESEGNGMKEICLSLSHTHTQNTLSLSLSHSHTHTFAYTHLHFIFLFLSFTNSCRLTLSLSLLFLFSLTHTNKPYFTPTHTRFLCHILFFFLSFLSSTSFSCLQATSKFLMTWVKKKESKRLRLLACLLCMFATGSCWAKRCCWADRLVRMKPML